MKKALIILPTYNEAGSIEELVHKIFGQQQKVNRWELHVLIVDSYSTDATPRIVKSLMKENPRLYMIEMKKEGLGKAYINGFTYGIEQVRADVMFEMDADLSHDPDDIPRFLKKIDEGADFVVGSRYMDGGSIPDDWGLHRKILSVGANLFIRLGMVKFKTTEWTNGYRALRSSLVKHAFHHIRNYSGYVFQVAFLDYAIKHNAKTAEIPVHFKDRTSGYSKIDATQYIVHSILYVLQNSSFIKFATVGVSGFIIDFTVSHIGIDILHKPVWISTLISAETAIISNFTWNNLWSFSHKRIANSAAEVIPSFIKFNSIASGSLVIQTVGVQLFATWLGRDHWYIYKIFIIAFLIIPYSYILYNRFIWKNREAAIPL